MSTYYVTHNAGGGGAGTEGDPYTIVEAADNVVAGDTVYVKATGDYTVQDGANNCVLYLTITGTSGGSPILWIGYTNTINDGGTVTLDASVNTLTYVISSSGVSHHHGFYNFRCTGAASYGVDLTAEDYLRFENCRFDNNGSVGIWADNYCMFYKCQADNNGDSGLMGDVPAYVGCKSFDNTARGLDLRLGNIALFNITYGNGDDGIKSTTNNLCFIGNSLDGENVQVGMQNDGASAGGCVFLNNIIFDHATGIAMTTDMSPSNLSDYNLFYSNPTDRTNIEVGDNDVAGSEDPYTNSTAHDYTLKASSEAEDAGFDRGEV